MAGNGRRPLSWHRGPFPATPGSVMKKRGVSGAARYLVVPSVQPGSRKIPPKGGKWSRQSSLALSHTTSRSCFQCSTVSGLAAGGRGQHASSDGCPLVALLPCPLAGPPTSMPDSHGMFPLTQEIFFSPSAFFRGWLSGSHHEPLSPRRLPDGEFPFRC